MTGITTLCFIEEKRRSMEEYLTCGERTTLRMASADQSTNHATHILVDDIDAQIGKEEHLRNVAGKETIPNYSNSRRWSVQVEAPHAR